MSIIHLLDNEVSNKIAAGEVVERPASVVKELVENALDAEAKTISIRIERAGTRLIAVSDDGCGMDSDDALLCFEPHATSKIETDSDILHIATFGFRGEAMPSIASVSRMTLKTRKRDSREGVCVTVNAGKFGESVPAGCAPGTEITVRDLFYNVPARKKFLKSPATEERHIIDIVSLISLAHPVVAFELVMDGRTVIASPAGDKLLPRIRDVFGRDTADAMLPLDHTAGQISVRGFITRRGITRPTRQDQKIFVNGRPVESLPVYRGIRDGCGPMLEKGRCHPAVVFIDLPAEFVDVNVHPTKREVRFRNEFDVTDCVRAAVAEALRESAENTLMQPAASAFGSIPVQNPVPASAAKNPPSPAASFLREAAALQNADAPLARPAPLNLPVPPVPSENPVERLLASVHVDYLPLSVQQPPEQISMPFPEPEKQESAEPANSQKRNNAFPGCSGLELLGVLGDTYLVAKMADGLVLIDQHAAHERVLYERILHGVEGSLSQKLLVPITVELSKADLAYVTKNREYFAKLGFEIDPFGGSSIKLSAIPAALKQDNAGGMFVELLARAADEDSSGARPDSASIARAACKAAVKANDPLSPAECRALIDQLAACELPFCCPHGRPTLINISIRELERRFGRVR